MAEGRVIPFARPEVARRTIEIAAPAARPDIQAVLAMLGTIDPALLARFTPQTTRTATSGAGFASDAAPAASRPVPDEEVADDLPCPPPPANDAPLLPRPSTVARVRALTSLVFPDGSSRILTCTLPRIELRFCLR